MSNDKSPPRHWHGTVGDRYEHHNVWVRGGPPSTYMARRPSTSTTDATATSDRRSSSASENSANTNERAPPTVAERRRSSAHGPSSLFESLTSQKRNPNDGAFAARRQSWNEQARPGGYFSKWWSGYTGGNK